LVVKWLTEKSFFIFFSENQIFGNFWTKLFDTFYDQPLNEAQREKRPQFEVPRDLFFFQDYGNMDTASSETSIGSERYFVKIFLNYY
jgi:hypothetical protein